MNELLVKIEELPTSDLTYIFEYLVDLINARKEQEAREKKAKRKNECKQKNLKQ